MNATLSLVVAGGDLRQTHLCRLLLKDGHKVSVFGLERHTFPRGIDVVTNIGEACKKADAVILPMPVTQDDSTLNGPLSNAPRKLEAIAQAIPPGKMVLCGALSEKVRTMFLAYGITPVDYLNREELALLNAIPTCEGAIQIAMEELPVTIHGLNVLVSGSGRLGKCISQKLAALCADVTVSARKEKDFALLYSKGLKYIDTAQLESAVPQFDLIINTIPSKLYTRSVLSKLREECLLIDLASKPGGVDLKSAQDLGIKVIWALSLPGKVAPVTSAEAIKKVIYNVLKEGGGKCGKA